MVKNICIIKDQSLKVLDEELFNLNKFYSLAINSLGRVPNLYAYTEFKMKADGFLKRLKSLKLTNKFDLLIQKNSILNIERQIDFLEYFTLNKKQTLDKFISKVYGKDAMKIVLEGCKSFDYKSYWDFFMSYESYAYRSVPIDDEFLREKFRKILEDLKKDILAYGVKHYGLDKDYDFYLALGQPYSSNTYYQPSTRRMEIATDRFFAYKEDKEININIWSVVLAMFHEVLGHGRHEDNSKNMPMVVQNNSINTSLSFLHVHFEAISQLMEFEGIEFLKQYQEKYKIKDDYILQAELSLRNLDYSCIRSYFSYLKLKNLENKEFNVKKEFLSVFDNPGLYMFLENEKINHYGFFTNVSYILARKHIKIILENIKKKLGEKEFDKNKVLINRAISTGVFNIELLEEFVMFYLESSGLKFK